MEPSAEDSAILNAILEAAVDSMIVSDVKGTILRANSAAAKMFAYDVAQMVGQNVRMLMPQALAEIHDGFMTHHIETGEKRIIGLGRDVEGLRGRHSFSAAPVGRSCRNRRQAHVRRNSA